MIAEVTKDPGGMNVILGVHKLFPEMLPDKEVKIFSNGASVKLLTERGVKHTPVETAADVFRIADMFTATPPELLITDMSSDGGLGRLLVKSVAARTIAIQDFWGARLNIEFKDELYWPDYILVPDAVGKELVLGSWKGYREEDVRITGWIAFDNLASMNQPALREKLRGRFELKENWPVVVFVGQIDGTAGTFEETVQALNLIGRPVYLLPRWHPRVQKDGPAEHEACLKLMGELRAGRIIDTNNVPYAEFPSDEIVAASDVVTGMFSTDLAKAAQLKKEVISVLYPELGLARFKSLTKLEKFPLVELGCAVMAQNQDELKYYLRHAIDSESAFPGLDCGPDQEKHFPCDGMSAKRAMKEIISILD